MSGIFDASTPPIPTTAVALGPVPSAAAPESSNAGPIPLEQYGVKSFFAASRLTIHRGIFPDSSSSSSLDQDVPLHVTNQFKEWRKKNMGRGIQIIDTEMKHNVTAEGSVFCVTCLLVVKYRGIPM
jgi:hypothetical protein